MPFSDRLYTRHFKWKTLAYKSCKSLRHPQSLVPGAGRKYGKEPMAYKKERSGPTLNNWAFSVPPPL
ncbi:hypothetical protein Y1Q_0022702 [Alligator mississippiensis]|uniref:Uncharacterized protein n=1 Tax=Alligator mississippiensis TaxID=8496 RepID=A0A151MY78_ALLMI|nr:hypothetical protein Y1Q_0022702 [Alligator mississippiensis]